MENDDTNWFQQRAEADRAEVTDWMRSKIGQRVLLGALGLIALWIVVQFIWSAL